MSHAPVPSLRSLWANGGAPGAFVRRDASLTNELERVLRAAESAASFGDANAFGQLVARVGWNELLPEESARLEVDTVSDDPVSRRVMNHPRIERAHAGSGSTELQPERRADISMRRRPAMSAGGAAPDAPHRSASHGLDDTSILASSHAAPALRTAESTNASNRVATAANGPVDSSPEITHGAHTAAMRPWRRVPPLRSTNDAQVAARIADILGAAAPAVAATPRVYTHGEPDHHAGDDGASTVGGAMNRLARAVSRVEQQHAAVRRANSGAPSLPSDRPNRSTHFEPFDRVHARSAPRDVLPPAMPPHDLGATPSQSTGLRGLVERASTARATFFYSAADYVDQIWPDHELDRMSALLDDAARREGVDLEEGLA